MSVTEIVLLIVGVVFFAISFFLPDGKTEEVTEPVIDENKIKQMVEKEVGNARERINDMVDETVNYSIEKTERALERISTEKIMAVDEYSETVLKKINDNHNEAVFLYDMLNDKDEKIKNSNDALILKDEQLKAKDEELKRRDEELKQEKALKEREEEIARNIQKELEDKLAASKEQEFVPFIPERIVIKDDNVIEAKEEPSKPEEEIKNTSSAAMFGELAKSINSNPSAGKKNTRAAKSRTKVSAPVDDDDDMSVYVSFKKGEDNKKNRNEEIKRLHEAGKSNMAIAKELGLGVGEVKLVLDLFSTRM